MTQWQADFYHYSPEDRQWNLLICDEQGQIILEASCPQTEANSSWLIEQIESLSPKNFPEEIKVFRPSIVSLFSLGGQVLGIKIIATRRTDALKQILLKKYKSDALKLDFPPPQALPEFLWGQTWQFTAFPAADIIDYFTQKPIPIKVINSQDHPLKLGISSQTLIPGVIIEGGKTSRQLARWLGEQLPYSLNYIPTDISQSGGLILESGLVDRWILVTFEDRDIAQSAQQYEQRKKDSQGLHFLLIQPDNTGVTYSGFWLLKSYHISH